jgi:hypothetical protein
MGRDAVPERRLLCKAVRTSVEPVVGLELEGRAKPVTGRPDDETGRTDGSKLPDLFDACVEFNDVPGLFMEIVSDSERQAQ